MSDRVDGVETQHARRGATDRRAANDKGIEFVDLSAIDREEFGRTDPLSGLRIGALVHDPRIAGFVVDGIQAFFAIAIDFAPAGNAAGRPPDPGLLKNSDRVHDCFRVMFGSGFRCRDIIQPLIIGDWHGLLLGGRACS